MSQTAPSSARPGLLTGLTGRILLSLVLVSMVAVGLVALLANRATTSQFELYVSRGRQMRAERLAPYFAAYYLDAGSWDGVQALVDGLETTTMMGGRGMGMGMGRGSPSSMSPMMGLSTMDRLILADMQGRVIADSEVELRGGALPTESLDDGAPILIGGTPRAVLLVTSAESIHDPAQSEFLQQVNRSLVWAGLASAVAAVVLGFFLARRLTAPLQALTVAAERISEGNLDQRVDVRGNDEISDLGRSFNRMAEALVQQERLRRDLMADIAHELRTPLAVIRGDLEALLDGVYDVTVEGLASLQEETILLSRLVDDLRALSLAEAGQLQLKRERVNLRDVLVNEISTFAPLAARKGVSLTCELREEKLEIDADPKRLQQVVANLLSNALHHTPEGGTITLAARELVDGLEMTVTDTGPGIQTEDLPRVFDRFWRSDTAQPGEGSGLGLAIVRGLVQAHGGRVWAESQPGEGARFRVMLPKMAGNTHQ